MIHRHFPLFTFLALIAAPLSAQEIFDTAAVATGHPYATRTALNILRAGGNAVDAAVAAGFVLGVVEPHASGLGGSGFMVVKMANRPDPFVIDFRGTAPLATDMDVFMKPNGEPNQPVIERGALSVAVPGEAAGLRLALEQAGTMPWDDLIRPAIDYAVEGFRLTGLMANIYGERMQFIGPDAGLSALLAPNGRALGEGARLTQPRLAETLRQLGANGPRWFYTGPVAEEMVSVVGTKGGWLAMDDMRGYAALVRQAHTFTYRGHRIVTIGPPSLGSMIVARTLRSLESRDLSSMNRTSASTVDLIADELSEAAAICWPAVADPAFVEEGIDVEWLTTPSDASVEPARRHPPYRPSTTSLSIIDEDGNSVSMVQTLTLWLGSAILLPNSGVLLNNEMADFEYYPGHINMPRPRARPSTALTQVLVLDSQGRVTLSLGTAGGARIPSAIVEILINLIDYNMNLREAIRLPRFHPVVPGGHELAVEGGTEMNTIHALKERGWTLEERERNDSYFGGAQAVEYNPATGQFAAYADPRRDGDVAGY